MSKPFRTTIESGIAEVILDHPPVNAFDSAGWFAIADEIDALGANDTVRVIIVAAEGKGFCAGVDIKELAADRNRITAVNQGNYDTFEAIHRNPRPVVVALLHQNGLRGRHTAPLDEEAQARETARGFLRAYGSA